MRWNRLQIASRPMILLQIAGTILGPTLLAPVARGAEEPASTSSASQSEAVDLAKKLTNPVADLVSVPFQANWNMGVGPDDDTQWLLNFQPVVPIRLSAKWNLIQRVIIPVLSQPPLAPGGESTFGLGDILASSFFSPVESKIIWGVGPALSVPISTDPALGSEKWSIGPTFVILKQSGPWTYGVLWNQIWSFADAGGTEAPDVSQMFTQPFLAYTNKKAVTFTINSETTTNWKAPDGEEWTIPVNLMVAKLSKFGPFPASYQFALGYYIDSPEGGPSWKIRAVFTLLLPKGKAS
jgi:hypothetical protein